MTTSSRQWFLYGALALLFGGATAAVNTMDEKQLMHMYFGNGCFFAHQHVFVENFERKVLKRHDQDITSIAGYAGSVKVGAHGSLCYHNAENFSDYGLLGHAEAVSVDVPMDALASVFSAYFNSFVEQDEHIWGRPDFFDQGPEYRSLIGFSGGMDNDRVVAVMKKANLHNMSLLAGKGSDPDSFGKNLVFVMDSEKFPFTQAERCLQFHDDPQVTYPPAYHKLEQVLETSSRIVPTKCPANYICNSTVAEEATPTKKPPWYGLGKGRKCPAWPKTQKDCPIKNITDKFGEYEPVCILHFPQIGGEFAEQPVRRCMPGEHAPYFKDSQGIFRCACCGAPLWKPSQQFDQLPADRWEWPSFHSPPLNNTDGLPSVCHRGPPVPGTADRNMTVDLGLGAPGEIGCAHCGAHLGDYFDDQDDGMDHYCINGVCMIPPGGPLGSTCAPTETDEIMI